MKNLIVLSIALLLPPSNFTASGQAPPFIRNGMTTNTDVGHPTAGQVPVFGAGHWTYAAGAGGTNGVNGTNGLNGVNGTNGAQGIQGIQGIQGVAGTSGTNGAQGVQGIQGVPGINGTNGLNGTSGTNGATGPQGIQGVAGVSGTNGLNGINGTNGAQGVAGINGTNGVNGTNGLNGVNGTNANTALVANSWDTNSEATISQSIDWQARLLQVGGGISVDWGNWSLFDSNPTLSLNWNNRILYDSSGNSSLDWGSGAVGFPQGIFGAVITSNNISGKINPGQIFPAVTTPAQVAAQISTNNAITTSGVSLAVWSPTTNTYYTNLTSAVQFYQFNIRTTYAAVTGSAQMNAYLWGTNKIALYGQTTAVGSIGTTAFEQGCLAVPPGAFLAFTNSSSGSGNSAFFSAAESHFILTFKP